VRARGDGVVRAAAGRPPQVQHVWHAWERELYAEVAVDRAATGPHLPRRVAHMLRQRDTLLRQMAAGEALAPGGESRAPAAEHAAAGPSEPPPPRPPPPERPRRPPRAPPP